MSVLKDTITNTFDSQHICITPLPVGVVVWTGVGKSIMGPSVVVMEVVGDV